MVTLRDRFAICILIDSLAWATLGSITRMMQARSGVQSSEFFLKIQA